MTMNEPTSSYRSLNICEDCTIPPNFIYEFIESLADNKSDKIGVMCRDCGDYWEEETE